MSNRKDSWLNPRDLLFILYLPGPFKFTHLMNVHIFK